ncbi:MAG: DUF3999 domain-containing protein [Desulfobulbus sp.]|nr:DUF3999 domain-containing protein [Desulfobulbus sp.]
MPRKRALLLPQIALCLVLCSAPSAWAAAPSLADYAYGCSLPVNDTTGLYVLDLPLTVYLELQRSDQGDLQVFNGAGQPVPQAIRRHDSPQIPVRQPVPFFPLRVDEHNTSPDLSVRVQRHSDGSIITIQNGASPAGTITRYSYLLDLNGYESAPTALELSWQEENTSNEMIALKVSQSSDLAHWQTVRDKVVLAELVYNGGKVSQRSFSLPGAVQPYLRLECRDCRQPLKLTAVSAVSGPSMKADQWQWQQLKSDQVLNEEGWWRIEYHNPAKFRVTALNLTFPQPNSLARVVIESRATAKAPWRRIGGGDFYRLDLQGSLLTSPFLPCPTNTDRSWRLSVAKSNSLVNRELLPQLRLGWQPDELVFLGRGPGPYTLAFGSSKVTADDATQDALILTALQRSESDSHLNRITPGPLTQLAGEQALQPQVAPLPWQRILLWVVLVAGVGLLAIMARSVYREMQRKQN